MARRVILKVGDEVLRKVSKEVTAFDERLWRLLDDLKDTMYKAKGVGLAAVQVGILKRAAIVDTGYPDNPDLVELINPVIVKTEGSQRGREGCLSVPNREEQITRPDIVTVEAQDRHGVKFTVTAQGFKARAFCHEIDHMNGKLYIDLVDGQ